MKQILQGCIFLLIITMCFMGCSKEPPQLIEPNFTEQAIIISSDYSDIDGIFIQANGIYIYPDKTELVVVWSNQTNYSIKYGTGFEIERLQNGEWVRCAVVNNDNDFVTLSSNRRDNQEYIITDIFDVDAPGTYRFHSSCIVDNDNQTECMLWSEFIIE